MSRLGFWKMIPICLRTAAGSLRTSTPAIRTRPDVGASVVVRMEMVVVLPAPLGPRRAKNSPGPTPKLMLSTALCRAPRYRLTRRSTSTTSAASHILEDPSKRPDVARISALLSQHPVLGSPEEVRVQAESPRPGPAHALVVVLYHLLGQAAIHSPAVWIGGRRHRLPRLCLPLGDHQLPSMRVSPGAQLLASALLPGAPAAVQVHCPRAEAHQRVARVVVDADDIGQPLCDGQ